MNKMSCFLLLAVLAAGYASEGGMSDDSHPVPFDDDTHTLLLFIPTPLYCNWTRTKGLDTLAVLPLFFWESQKRFYTPLFMWNKWGTFWTLLGGRFVGMGNVVYDCYTPFFGNTSGTRVGGWVFPFWRREKDLGFDERRTILEEGHLPKDIRIRQKEGRLDADLFRKSDRKTCLLFMDFSEEVHSDLVWNHDGTNCRYRVTHEKKRDFGLFDFNAKHQIEFDVNTREAERLVQ